MQQPPFPGWRDFVAQHWEAKALSFEDADSGLCDEDAVLDGLKCAAEKLRNGSIRDHRDLSFHLDKSVVVDPGPYLPQAPETLDQYFTRLESLVPKQPFTLLVNNFQEFSPRLCLAMRFFARNLFEHLGWLPAGMVSSHAMLARYAVSPFAVHKDPNSVFTFLIRGTKTLRVWPFEVLSEQTQQRFARHRQLNLYDFDYRPFKDKGIALTGRPGNVLYWPSTFWHVGETEDESIHISLHLTFDVHSEPRGEVVDLLHKVVEDSLTESDWHTGYPIEDLRSSGLIEPPDQLKQAFKFLTEANQATIEESIYALWLGRMSAQGFWTIAEPSNNSATGLLDLVDTALRVDPVFPVYWIISGGNVTLAAHGQVIRFPERGWTSDVLLALSDRRLFQISEFARPGDRAWQEIRMVAAKLVRIGAVQISNESCSMTAS